MPGDVGTAAGVDAVAEQSLDVLGGVDVLVNNAGGFSFHLEEPADIPDDDWVAALELNYLSTVRMDRALSTALVQSSGVIVEMSSVSARTPAPQTLPYAAAKAALTTYAKGLSRSLGKRGVRVNTVLPGTIETEPIDEMIATIARAAGIDESAATEMVVGDVPLNGPGRPADIAELVAFLASPRSSWITGATFVIDGGQLQTV